jgi:hypothetical protein
LNNHADGRLESLDLSCNMLGDEGLSAILASPEGAVAPSLVSLTALNLSENNLTGFCANSLGAFLQHARCAPAPQARRPRVRRPRIRPRMRSTIKNNTNRAALFKSEYNIYNSYYIYIYNGNRAP